MKTHNDKEINADGTFLHTRIFTTYDKIVEVFGQPVLSQSRSQADAKWIIETDDGSIITIYNSKDGRNYLGKDGKKVSDIEEWSVGANEVEVKVEYDTVVARTNARYNKKAVLFVISQIEGAFIIKHDSVHLMGGIVSLEEYHKEAAKYHEYLEKTPAYLFNLKEFYLWKDK